MIKPTIFESAEAVVEALAQRLLQESQFGLPVHVSLSGGSTPIRLFKRLAEDAYAETIQWQNLHFWWGDERCVPPSSPDSNYGEANRLLFSKVSIPSENIHRICGEVPPEQELMRFIDEMNRVLPKHKGLPQFDWILLGMGEDGHTASLFPNQTNFDDLALAVIAKHPESGQLRISKSAKLLENAQCLTYLVLGENKSALLAEINQNDENDLPYPAAKIRSTDGVTEWYLDFAAASALA
jgi:6-phosphogluconolactonase